MAYRTIVTGWDLDGCVYNFADGMRNYFKHIGIDQQYPMGEMGTHPDTYDWWSNWGMTERQWKQHVHDGVDAGIIFCGGVIEDAIVQMNRVYNAGHQIHIVTARDYGGKGYSERNTRRWLDEHGIPFHSLTFSKDKTVVKTDVFIEDVISNYDALEAVGTKSYLINRPWNQQDDNRRRVTTLRQYADAILGNQE